jgi:hypothetical protein
VHDGTIALKLEDHADVLWLRGEHQRALAARKHTNEEKVKINEKKKIISGLKTSRTPCDKIPKL